MEKLAGDYLLFISLGSVWCFFLSWMYVIIKFKAKKEAGNTVVKHYFGWKSYLWDEVQTKIEVLILAVGYLSKGREGRRFIVELMLIGSNYLLGISRILFSNKQTLQRPRSVLFGICVSEG